MKVSERHKYRVGQRLRYDGPGGGPCEVVVTELREAAYSAQREPMYGVRRDDDLRDWPSSESRLSDPKET